MTYEIVNALTANSIASFGSEAEAVAAMDQIAASSDELGRNLVVVPFDDEGIVGGGAPCQGIIPEWGYHPQDLTEAS